MQRRTIVAATRKGQSIRETAEQFGVAPSTVEFWIALAKGKRLDRVDWSDPPRPANRSSEEIEQCVLAIRKQLKEESVLGEHGKGIDCRQYSQEHLF